MMDLQKRNNKIYALYRKGIKRSEIGKKFSLSKHTISNILGKSNVNMRHGREAILVYKCNESFFKSINEKSCYWAGYIAADGCISDTGIGSKILRLGCGPKDIDHLKRFLRILDSNHKIFTRRFSLKNRDKIYINHYTSISSEKLCRDLIDNFNVTPRKSLTYVPPKLSNNMMRHFIRGYHSGDGWFCKRKKRKKDFLFGLMGTEKCMKIFRDWIVKNCDVGPNKICKDENVFRLSYEAGNALKAINALEKGASIFMNRKTLKEVSKR